MPLPKEPYSSVNSIKVTAEFLRKNTRHWPPHVVVLGAGASIQAFPKGDLNGRQLPCMDNLVELIGFRDELKEMGFSDTNINFEIIYSQLHTNPKKKDCINLIEQKIFKYFSEMQLPKHPTLYDHLLLSLRNHDLVATFNWDPFLFDSWERLSNQIGINNLPQLSFLHGNVRLGYCLEHKVFGRIGRICPDCDQQLKPIPLLYPIENKDYESNLFIKDAWNKLEYALQNALGITIFGYGAPASDRAAIEAMETAWNSIGEREFETIFVIDTKDASIVQETWSPFIYSHHYNIVEDFYESSIPRHARRNTEALIARTLEGHFVEECPIPKKANWKQLYSWFSDLARFENK